MGTRMATVCWDTFSGRNVCKVPGGVELVTVRRGKMGVGAEWEVSQRMKDQGRS